MPIRIEFVADDQWGDVTITPEALGAQIEGLFRAINMECIRAERVDDV